MTVDCRVGSWRGFLVLAVGLQAFIPRVSPVGCPTCFPWPGRFRFQLPPPRTVHAVLPHTAHRRRSPPAFGLSRQGLPALGSTTSPESLIRPNMGGLASSSTN